MTDALRITLLFAVTAVAEILGCWLPLLVLRGGKSIWLLVPAALCLAAFAWLLTLHPMASGRIYLAYSGVYILVALVWLRLVDGVVLTWWDGLGAVLAMAGMLAIVMQPGSGE